MTGSAPRRLIVNGDDFGRTPGITAGVVTAYRRGILTSASMMVRWPAAEAAAVAVGACPELAVGLHVDLGEWAVRGGAWHPVYEVVDTEDPRAVRQEVERQVARFRELLGREPTHLDSHQHVHRREPAMSALDDMARRLAVPLRDRTDGIRHCGDFYGQDAAGRPYREGITVAALQRLLAGLAPGITELSCHPGEGGPFESTYGHERVTELRTLCDASVRRCIDDLGIVLCSFADIDGRQITSRRPGPPADGRGTGSAGDGDGA